MHPIGVGVFTHPLQRSCKPLSRCLRLVFKLEYKKLSLKAVGAILQSLVTRRFCTAAGARQAILRQTEDVPWTRWCFPELTFAGIPTHLCRGRRAPTVSWGITHKYGQLERGTQDLLGSVKIIDVPKEKNASEMLADGSAFHHRLQGPRRVALSWESSTMSPPLGI